MAQITVMALIQTVPWIAGTVMSFILSGKPWNYNNTDIGFINISSNCMGVIAGFTVS
jgi:hypothetical protein